MSELTLPFQDTFEGVAPPGGTIFSITSPNNAMTAISGSSYGGDPPYGDTPTGVSGGTDIGIGVAGAAQTGMGVQGYSDSGQGVAGQSVTGVGVQGYSDSGPGVTGQSGTPGGVGQSGTSSGTGVHGTSVSGFGVYGETSSADAAGVAGVNPAGDGVRGTSNSPLHAGVAATNSSAPTGDVPSGFAIWAGSNNTGIYVQGTPAGYFAGDVLVTGDLVLINGGDIAEDFDVEEHDGNCEPGSVLVISADGKLGASDVPYDTRVAGVVSGAGDLKPGVVLQRIPSALPRTPIALVGKVFCKVDATYGKIAAGDLLTTSRTPGHAMKASDKSQALGAILGKALASLEEGCGLVPIMVSLR
jgi:hypothetical protein